MEPMDLLPPIGQLANSLSKPQQPALPGKKRQMADKDKRWRGSLQIASKLI